MKSRLIGLVLLIILWSTQAVRANHVLGGEFRLAPADGGNRYTLSMLIFWDETQLSFANRDPYADVMIYRKRDNRLMQGVRLPFVSDRSIAYPNQDCATSSFQTLEARFSKIIEMDAGTYNDADGYYVVWERCCRSAGLSNLIDPGSTGLAFYLEFPPLSVRNSSPVFDLPNGGFICRGLPYSMKLAATDADGDALRYSLVVPTKGNTTLAEPRGNDAPKAGYPSVQLAPGIAAQNLIPGNPPLSIDDGTGVVTVTASQLGLYVFTIQCEEFRNGKRIGMTRRDFQSLVIECQPQTPPAPTILYNQQPVPNIQLCDSSAVLLAVAEAGEYNYQWQFNAEDIPGATEPGHRAAKDGAYTVKRSFKVAGNCSQPSKSSIVYLVQGRTPDATINKTDAAICEGKRISLVADRNEDYDYQWRRNDILLDEKSWILLVTEAGRYQLDIRNKSNGCTASDSVTLASESVRLTLPPQISTPRGISVQLMPEITSSFLPLKYFWTPAASLSDATVAKPQASPDSSTTYTLTVETPGGCKARDTIRLVILECTPEIPTTPIIKRDEKAAGAIVYACADDSIKLETLYDASYTYQWQLNGLDIVGATSAAEMAIDSGDYTVVVGFREVDPCKISVTSNATRLLRVENPAMPLSTTTQRICQEGTIKLSAATRNDYQYQWTGPGKESLGPGLEILVDRPGWYRLMTTDVTTGCASTDSTLLIEEILRIIMPRDVSVPLGESVVILPMVETNATDLSYTWSSLDRINNPADTVLIASPIETTLYILKVETANGCTATDSIKVFVVEQLFVPDAFTPNGDGVNDLFVIQNGAKLIKSVRIYNRWGEVVFGAEDYIDPWDGRLRAVRVPTGAYVYVIETEKATYKGIVSVMY